MSKLRIVIVEDEPLIADDLAAILEKNGFQIVGIADEADEALELVTKQKPDLALLDINIEGNQDGIQLAAQLKIPFIFITSFYDQRTLERVQAVHPAGYIVKPFSERDLLINIELARSRHMNTNKFIAKRPPEKLFFRKDQEIIALMSDQILYVEAYDNYAWIFTEKAKYLISHTLKSIEEKIVPLGFIRVHRSFLINFEMIESIAEGYVFLKGIKIQLGKSYKKDFLDQLSLL